MGNRAFKAHDGHFLCAEQDTLKLHHAHHSNHHSHFHVESHGHDKVALRTHCGKYVSIGDHKEIYLSHHFHGEHSLFHLEKHHGKVAIKGHHHLYIGAEHGHVKVHHERGHHELFEEVIC